MRGHNHHVSTQSRAHVLEHTAFANNRGVVVFVKYMTRHFYLKTLRLTAHVILYCVLLRCVKCWCVCRENLILEIWSWGGRSPAVSPDVSPPARQPCKISVYIMARQQRADIPAFPMWPHEITLSETYYDPYSWHSARFCHARSRGEEGGRCKTGAGFLCCNFNDDDNHWQSVRFPGLHFYHAQGGIDGERESSFAFFLVVSEWTTYSTDGGGGGGGEEKRKKKGKEKKKQP